MTNTCVIPSGQAAKWALLRLNSLPSDLRLSHLTSADTRLANGLDSSSLHATDSDLTQTWAELLAPHPQRFGGMRDRIRQSMSFASCSGSSPVGVVRLISDSNFFPAGDFLQSDAAYILAGKVGTRLSFLG